MSNVILHGLGPGGFILQGLSSGASAPSMPPPVSGVRYASDVNNGTTPFAVDNVAERYIDRDILTNTAGALYPSSIQQNNDTLVNPTRTLGDLALAINMFLAEAWQLSQRMPGINQVSSAGAAPSAPSSQPTNVVANESAYLAQLQSLKYNTIRRHLDRILPVMKRLRDNIDGAVGAPGDQSPSARTDGRYPADIARGY